MSSRGFLNVSKRSQSTFSSDSYRWLCLWINSHPSLAFPTVRPSPLVTLKICQLIYTSVFPIHSFCRRIEEQWYCTRFHRRECPCLPQLFPPCPPRPLSSNCLRCLVLSAHQSFHEPTSYRQYQSFRRRSALSQRTRMDCRRDQIGRDRISHWLCWR